MRTVGLFEAKQNSLNLSNELAKASVSVSPVAASSLRSLSLLSLNAS